METFTRKETQDNFVTEKVDIFKNNLLGEYDDNGHYSIAPQIVNELIELKKFKKKSYDNSVFCFGSLLGYGEIAFELTFEKTRDDNNKAIASLYVLEDVDKINGYIQNIIKTKIADFSSDVGDFIDQAYIKFNITDGSDIDDEGKERKSLDDLELEDSYILAKKAYMLLLDKLSDEKMLDAYGKYFTARLTLLTKAENEFSQAVLDVFNSRYELIEDVFLKEKNYKCLNELLDSCIESVSGTKEIFVEQENQFNNLTKEHLDTFVDSINKLNDKIEQKAIDLLDPEDRTKLNQMNASFDNAPRQNTEVTNNENTNEIDDAFENPVYEVEEVSSNQIDEENQNTSNEKSLTMEELMSTMKESYGKTESLDEREEDVISEQNDETIESDISQEFVDSQADFHKSRQNDRVFNITDRLSRLSEDSIKDNSESIEESISEDELVDSRETSEETIDEELPENNIEETVEEPNNFDLEEEPNFDMVEESNFDENKEINFDVPEEINYNENEEFNENIVENNQNNEERVGEEFLGNPKLRKDRFSVLFDYLEKHQEEKDNDEKTM